MSLNLHLPHKNEVRRLPKSLQDYIHKRFLLGPVYLKQLRSFEFESMIGDKPVKRFKIFNIEEIREKNIALRAVRDLEQHPEAVIFEGYIDVLGNAYAADRRSPNKIKRHNENKENK